MAPLAADNEAYNALSGKLLTKRLMRIKVKPNPVDELIEIKNGMSKDQLRNFKLKYGDILDLLSISVPTKAISALCQHWDKQLRCFVFAHFHLSLVLEEYAGLMRMPLSDDPIVYVYPGHLPSRNVVARFLEEPLGRVKFIKQGQSDVIPLTFLVEYMRSLAKRGNHTLFNRVLALAIYGIVLFPSVAKSVDFQAISIFIAVEHHGVNPIPAILADTYLTLSYCHIHEDAKLKCCLQLLTVWMANHFVGRKWSKGITCERVYHPLQDFPLREGSIFAELNKLGAEYKDWVQFIRETPKDQVKWKLVWWDNLRVIYHCGDYPNVPLISARGVVNYSPSLAHMQLGYKQQAPSQDSIKPLFFFHNAQSIEENENVTKAWKKVYFKTRREMGPPNIEPTADYEEWLRDYVRGKEAPTFVQPEPLPRDDLQQVSLALKAEIEKNKDELDNILAETERQRKGLQKEKEEYVRAHRDVTRLKRKRQEFESTDICKLQGEVERLKAELYHNKTQKEEELREAYDVAAKASQDRIQDLEEYAADLQNQLDLERDTVAALKREIDDLTGVKEEVRAWRNKHARIIEWVNKAVPTFSETFWQAESCMALFYVPPALKDFLSLSRGLIKGWIELKQVV